MSAEEEERLELEVARFDVVEEEEDVSGPVESRHVDDHAPMQAKSSEISNYMRTALKNTNSSRTERGVAI
ncbi:hypothetical protein Y032_0317g2328 [Ancylostoma ceylanicum]|uniref:Uncharacterized protein n=1 Tax=Ancylostoma ceylanicum TaxID=53326 RepID=A0A016S1A5_9BILA|nr:hypothetical protein Y032_0317g2328 [Ancylostoma ceylanicum]